MAEPAIETAVEHDGFSSLSPARPLRLQPPSARPPSSRLAPDGSIAWPARLLREGEYWTILFDRSELRVRHSKGLAYLAELLSHPDTEIDVLTLARSASSRGVSVVDAAELAPSTDEDLGPILDANAKRAYRQRLQELREEIDGAQRFNDLERVARGRLEWSAIVDELDRATGLGGRDRRSGSSAERARVNITRAIKTAIARIATHDAHLGEYLLTHVHTGRRCVYRPGCSPRRSWEVRSRISPRRDLGPAPAAPVRNRCRAQANISYRVLGEWAVSAGVRTSLS